MHASRTHTHTHTRTRTHAQVPGYLDRLQPGAWITIQDRETDVSKDFTENFGAGAVHGKGKPITDRADCRDNFGISFILLINVHLVQVCTTWNWDVPNEQPPPSLSLKCGPVLVYLPCASWCLSASVVCL